MGLPSPMRLIWRAQGPLVVLMAFAVPLAAAAVMVPFRGGVPVTSLALVMVAVVVLTVAPGRRGPALVAGVSAGIWFDFFLTRPYESFSIRRGADVQSTLLLVAVALAVGEIAVRSRQHRAATIDSRTEVRDVRVVAQMLASGRPAAEVVATVAEELVELLSLRSCRFEPGDRRPAPYVARYGAVHFNNYSVDPARDGLPGRELSLPVESGRRIYGRFVLLGPLLCDPVPVERVLTAVALADLAGAAIAAERRIPVGLGGRAVGGPPPDEPPRSGWGQN